MFVRHLHKEDILNNSQAKKFDCGNQELNEYFYFYLSQDVKRRLTSAYVVLDDEQNLIGFYTLSFSSIKTDLISLKYSIPYSRVPVALLGRLAIQKEFQGKGFGGIILADAIKRIMNNELNPAGVIVDMKATELFHFYKKFGFIRLESNPLQCILVFSKLKQLPE